MKGIGENVSSFYHDQGELKNGRVPFSVIGADHDEADLLLRQRIILRHPDDAIRSPERLVDTFLQAGIIFN